MDQTPPQSISIDFKIGIGDGTFSATAVVPQDSCTLTQILPVIQALDDSFIDGITTQLNEAGLHISCKAGCGACCRQAVPLSIMEAEALGEWIATLPEEQQKELALRFHQALLKLSAAGMIDRLVSEDWLSAKGRSQQLVMDYFYAGVACPFLVNESCSIHPIRPLACREHLVTSDARYCSDPAAAEVDPAPMPLHFSRVLHTMGAEVEAGTRGWIPLVFLFAWMESGARPGSAFSGSGPEVLFEFVKRLSHASPPKTAE